MTVPSVREARALGDELQRDPLQHANHLVTLLNCLKPPPHEPVARAAIQALKLFYIAQHDAGSIASNRNKRQKLDQAAAAAAQQPDQQQQTAQQQYEAWLSRQYATFIDQLLQLLKGSSSPSIQVAAMSAVMECVRHEVGPAAFSNRLFSRLISALVLSTGAAPETLALLASKFLPCWDVRYHTLRTLTRLAEQRAIRGRSSSSTAAAGPDAADSDEEDADADTADGESGQQRLPKDSADVARTMFDILTHVEPIVVQQQQRRRQKQQQQQQEEEQDEEQQQQEDIQSWCGAAEAGLVKAASAAANLSSKARRKRKQQQQQQGSGAADGNTAAGAAAPASWANRKLQQKAYQEAWLAFLRTDLPPDIYKKVLLKLHSNVLPALSSPLLLSDFLTHALDQGGFEGMLALNGIFTLVTRHGLEYPAFYARLYALITPAAFLTKHRAQFFQLADIFLASGMVPAYTAAAFVKRFARLALTAPPAGALLAIGFIHNTIRRHPACMVMLHKPQAEAAAAAAAGANGAAAGGSSGGSSGAGVDVYDASEPDPAKSRAVESSLWELAALRNHYSPQVAALCAVLDKDLSDRIRTSEVDMTPLLTASYASLIGQELGRKLRKGVPVAFYSSQPSSLFDQDFLGPDMQGWDFSDNGSAA